jgi:TRAP-type transport system periplasmic protein
MARILTGLLGAMVLTFGAGPVLAQDPHVLRLHHFTPAGSNTQIKMLQPWADKVMAASDGRIKIEIYPSMQLGGKPGQLFEQVKDGVVDIAWVVPGYTAGRFPCVEIFEAPFVGRDAAPTSAALHQYATENCIDEFDGIRPIAFHVLATASLHSSKPVKELDDFKGLKVRAPTAMANKMVSEFGGVSVAMPFTQVAEAMSKGVVDALFLPMESVPTLHIDEMVSNHTEVSHDGPAIYTATLVLAMNPAAYAALPADLRAVIDENSGIETARQFGQVWDDLADAAREQVRSKGNSIIELSLEQSERWASAAEPVRAAWVDQMNKRGSDGAMLLERAKALIQQHSSKTGVN